MGEREREREREIARARDRGAGVLRNPKNNNVEATHNGTPDGVERVTLRDGRTEDRSRDWYCKCGERNFARRFECHLCGWRRPMPHISEGGGSGTREPSRSRSRPTEKKKRKKKKETSS